MIKVVLKNLESLILIYPFLNIVINYKPIYQLLSNRSTTTNYLMLIPKHKTASWKTKKKHQNIKKHQTTKKVTNVKSQRQTKR